MIRATVHVDLANKSCVITADDTTYGAWAPGITRRITEQAIAADGWNFAPDSEWTLTVDGGFRAVIRDDTAERADDRLLDRIGAAAPGGESGDELAALLLAWRHDVDTPVVVENLTTSECAA